jgi:flagellar basal-body rod modification protein FlgD
MSTLTTALTQVGNAASTAASTALGATTPSSTSGTGSSATGSSSSSGSGTNGMQMIAGDYNTFLQLLTTQLQNQDPLDPLDTDQFTQQLVEFASVEQQVNMNTNLQTLISMQQTSEATSALQLIGSTVTLNSNTATLSNATSTPASWSLSTTTPATANITISSSTGQVAYTGTLALNAGSQTFTWNGQSNGKTWPDGAYTISVSATGANGQAVTVTPQVQGTVTGVNVSASPPTVTVNGQSIPISQIQSISSSTLGSLSNLGSSITSLNSSIGNLSSLIQSL